MSATRAVRRWSAVGAAVVAAVAAAYVLPSYAILRRMTEARDDLHLFSVKVDGSASFFGSAVKEAGAVLSLPSDRPELQVDATVSLKLPGRCRIDLLPVEGGKAAAVEANGKRRLEGRELAPVNAALGEICALLAARSSSDGEARANVVRHLQGLKVDTQQTSLARVDRQQVAYVLGDTAPGKAQFWVLKDNFLPARVIFSDAQGVAWDVRFLDYTSPATGEWFPRQVEVARNGERVLRFTALKADTKVPLADKLF